MSNMVFFCSYKLKKDADISDFLFAAEKLNNEFISKQKGYISWNQLVDGETWVDFITFESFEDIKSFEAEAGKDEAAESFASFIDVNSSKVQYFSVGRSYKR